MPNLPCISVPTSMDVIFFLPFNATAFFHDLLRVSSLDLLQLASGRWRKETERKFDSGHPGLGNFCPYIGLRDFLPHRDEALT